MSGYPFLILVYQMFYRLLILLSFSSQDHHPIFPLYLYHHIWLLSLYQILFLSYLQREKERREKEKREKSNKIAAALFDQKPKSSRDERQDETTKSSSEDKKGTESDKGREAKYDDRGRLPTSLSSTSVWTD
jgi:hypothetical protein